MKKGMIILIIVVVVLVVVLIVLKSKQKTQTNYTLSDLFENLKTQIGIS